MVTVLALVACSDGDAADGLATTVPPSTTTTTGPSVTADGDDPEAPAEGVDLAGTSWRLVALVDLDGARTPADSEVPAVVTFDGDRVEGYDGVDTATGTWELTDDELHIDLEDVSELGAGTGPRAEQFLFDLLARVDRAAIEDGDLVLRHRNGELLLEPVGGDTAD